MQDDQFKIDCIPFAFQMVLPDRTSIKKRRDVPALKIVLKYADVLFYLFSSFPFNSTFGGISL